MYVIGYILYHPSSDFPDTALQPSGEYPPDTIRVEALVNLYGESIFMGSRHAAGYFLWRDSVNAEGGICLSEISASSCPKVSPDR